MENAECQNCKNTCNKCSGYPASLVVYSPTHVSWVESHQDTCHECGEQRWVNIVGACQRCFEKDNERTGSNNKLLRETLCVICAAEKLLVCTKCKKECDIYASHTTECPECFYGGNFMPKNNKVEKCDYCTNVSHLNSRRQCKDCYKEVQIHSSVTADSKNIKICKQCRKATSIGRNLCKECTKSNAGLIKCLGCNINFTPATKYSTFCSNCLSNLSDGKCTSCLKALDSSNEYFNERGHCASCT